MNSSKEVIIDPEPEDEDSAASKTQRTEKMSELMSLMMSPTQQINMAAAGAATGAAAAAAGIYLRYSRFSISGKASRAIPDNFVTFDFMIRL